MQHTVLHSPADVPAPQTTAHRPNWHPARATENQGNYRYIAPRQQRSVRAGPSHTKLKFRESGQDAPADVQGRDLKRELEAREATHFRNVVREKQRQGLLPYQDEAAEPAGDAVGAQLNAIDWKQFDDSDDDEDDAEDDAGASARRNDSESESDDDDDESDDEAALMRELEKIKREREAKRQSDALAAEREAKEEDEAEVVRGNPLLLAKKEAASSAAGMVFGVKRRWDDDVVFRDQSRDAKRQKKRFVNDTLRSDYHRAFMKKVVQ